MRLGLPFVPSYLGQSGAVRDMTHGLNYASAGAGIIFSSGSELVRSKTKILFKVPFCLVYKMCDDYAGSARILQSANPASYGYISAVYTDDGRTRGY